MCARHFRLDLESSFPGTALRFSGYRIKSGMTKELRDAYSTACQERFVIPGLTRNLGSCESVEFTGFRIRSGMTEIKNPDFLSPQRKDEESNQFSYSFSSVLFVVKSFSPLLFINLVAAKRGGLFYRYRIKSCMTKSL